MCMKFVFVTLFLLFVRADAVFPGATVYGAPIGITTAYTLSDCQTLCEQQNSCVFVKYTAGICQLFASKLTDAVLPKHHISGSLTNANSTTLWVKLSNNLMEPIPFASVYSLTNSSLNATASDSCGAACQSNTTCSVAVFLDNNPAECVNVNIGIGMSYAPSYLSFILRNYIFGN